MYTPHAMRSRSPFTPFGSATGSGLTEKRLDVHNWLGVSGVAAPTGTFSKFAASTMLLSDAAADHINSDNDLASQSITFADVTACNIDRTLIPTTNLGIIDQVHLNLEGYHPTDTAYDVIASENIAIGQPISVISNNQVALANCNRTSNFTLTGVIGLASTEGIATLGMQIRTEGSVELADWSAITGEEFLVPGAKYFLSSNTGQMSRYSPSGSDFVIVSIGRAVTTTKIDIEVNEVNVEQPFFEFTESAAHAITFTHNTDWFIVKRVYTTLGLSSSMAFTGDWARSASSAMSFSDLAAEDVVRPVGASSAILFTDLASDLLIPYTQDVTSVMTLSDATAWLKDLGRSATSAMTLSDSASKIMDHQLATSDAMSLTSFSSVVIPTAFVSVWNTSNTSVGSSNATQIALPLISTGTYNFSVDWGDGNTDNITAWNDSATTHNYASSGNYTLTLNGTIEGWEFTRYASDAQKISNVSEWGTLTITGGQSFNGCLNLTSNASDNITLHANTTNLASTFRECSLFDGTGVGDWNTHNITNMAAVFMYSPNMAVDVSSWNTHNVTSLAQAFSFSSISNFDVSSWNTHNVTNLSSVFDSVVDTSNDMSSWNTHNVTTIQSLASASSTFNGDITSWNTHNVTASTFAFFLAAAFDRDISSWNTHNSVSHRGMFDRAYAFSQNLSTWNTVNSTDFSRTFNGAALYDHSVGGWDWTGVTDATDMFRDVELHYTTYNATLTGINAQAVQNNVTFHGGDSMYSYGPPDTARSALIADHTWTITDGGPAHTAEVPDAITFTQGASGGKDLNYTLTNNMPLASVTVGEIISDAVSTMTISDAVSKTQDYALSAVSAASIIDTVTCIKDLARSASSTLSVTDVASGVIPVSAFTAVWNTADLSVGSSNSTQITLPLVSGGSYNFNVDWGDGNSSEITAWDDADATHNYASSGNYTLNITGTISGCKFAYQASDADKIGNVSSWGPFEVATSGTFNNCINLTSNAIDDMLLNTTNLADTFRGCTSYNGTGVSSWDTSLTTNMYRIFASIGSTQDITADISGWNTTNVTNMSQAFNQCGGITEGISSWNTHNVTTMSNMFGSGDKNPDVSSWNTSNVITMDSMFNNNKTFNQDIDGWDVSKVQNMSFMFIFADAFNQDLSSWNTHNVTTMRAMFNNTDLFNQDISGWNTSNVTTFRQMFQNASVFDQDVSGFDWTGITTAQDMFSGVTLSTTKYSSMIIGIEAQSVLNSVLFHGGNSTYNAAAATAHGNLGSDHSWTITDNGPA